MEKEKQKRIINAALKEFAEKGFQHASTNEIVKEAEIGKGMLFYYFNSKKSLYYYLIDYALDIIERKHLNMIDTSEQDLFKRLQSIASNKMNFLKKYPNAMNFMATILFTDDDEIDEDTSKKITRLQRIGYEKVYDNIDFALFREDVDPKKVFKIIRWAFEGYETELKYRLRNKDIRKLNFDPYWAEFYDYIDVMKKGFYK